MNAADAAGTSARGLFPTQEQYLVLQAALAERERALEAYAEWRRTLDIAAEFNYEVFRLVPLLYARLRELGVEDDLTGRLKGAYRMAWVKSHQLAEQMRPIIEGLADAGLRMLAIKGIPLAHLYYANPALRPMADFDLVVSPSDVATAKRVLGGLGYSSWMPVNEDTLRFRHAMCFCNAQSGELDLHWHVSFDLCDSGADRWFWNGAVPLEVAGRQLWAPDATRLLFLTVLHGMRWNAEPSIRWIPDAMQLLRRAEASIDWRAIVGFAESRTVCHRLWLGLSYLREHFGAPIPQEVVQRLGSRPVAWIERIENRVTLRDVQEVARGFFGNFWIEVAPYTRYAHDRGMLSALGGLFDYLKFIWGLPHRRAIPPYLLRRFTNRMRRLSHAPT